MTLQMPWGNGSLLKLSLPDNWNFAGELRANKIELTCQDPKLCLHEALKNPINQVPLSQMSLSGKNIAIVVDDITRPTPVNLLFPEVINEIMSAGAQKENIKIIFSLGTHRPLKENEMRNRLGIKDLTQYTVINHNCNDRNMLTFLGQTSRGTGVIVNKHVAEADLVISIGTIEPHLLAGFGGGLKNIIPGCAGMESISATHLEGVASERFNGVGKMGEEYSTRLLIEEGASMISGEYFLINTVLTPEGEIAAIFTGDPVKAHREGCHLAAKIYGVFVNKKADVVLTGSYPMDSDLRQGTKCLANASACCKEDGLIIAFMRCFQGIGDMNIPDYFLPNHLMRIFAKECGTERLVEIREKACGNMDMDEKYMIQFLTEICRKHQVLVYAPNLPAGTGEKLGLFEQFSDIDALFERAIKLLPEAGTVYSLPQGGITYTVYHQS